MSKRIWFLLAAALLLVFFAACGDESDAVAETGGNVPGESVPGGNVPGEELVEGDFLIASLQIVAHPALDASRRGFVTGLAEEGFSVGRNLRFEVFDAGGSGADAHLMAAQIVDMNPDLILGIATPTSQALAGATDTIPITITAVTSPYNAGLVESHERPNTNVTGTTDMTPVSLQFELITRIFPEAETVGILYNAGESNAVIQANIAEEAAASLGINLDRMTVAVAGDVMQAAEILVGRVDVIYTPTCNLMAASMTAIVRAAENLGVPVVAGDGGGVERGALITYGINYYELGRQTAQMAAQILRGEAQPQTMPIQAQAQYEFFVNISSAEILDIAIPEDILAIATLFAD
ncbi:MAG: ABC transporter substrate-binding protein [Defluviitaleaceae bacterium]|nr:ABC transporter substrate-binding protein [Defluviitaleaceae bacterium]